MEQENGLKWIIAARTLDGYWLHLTFNDGNQHIFDYLPLIEKYQLITPLRDKVVFDRFVNVHFSAESLETPMYRAFPDSIKITKSLILTL